MIQKTKSSSSEPPSYLCSGNLTPTSAACSHLECRFRRRFLAFSLLLSAPPAQGIEGAGRFSPDCSPLGVALGAPLPPVGGAEDLRRPPGLPLPLKPPGLGPPLQVFHPYQRSYAVPLPLSLVFGIRGVLCGSHPHNASACRNIRTLSCAEMFLVLYLLTIFGFLRALQLEHARTSPITFGRVAGSTLIFRRTTVEKIGGPLPLEGGVSFMCFSCHHGHSEG